ncbi:MAG: endonuclease [Gammaproteobacteria bacterium]|nr:endonuclease [Gammaproteobacteria bacterium]
MRINKRLLVAVLVVLLGPGVQGAEKSYLDNIPIFWRNLYPDGGTTLYCGEPFKPFDRRVNIEHVFPMSWATRHLGCGNRDRCRRTSRLFNRIETDMHNLYPALRDINEARGAQAFGIIDGERHLRRGCDFEVDSGPRRVEPRPAVRGDIARAMLYMEHRYGLPLYKRQRRLLEEWHRHDPPDAMEHRRNRLIEALQGQANPFIEGNE